MASRYSFALPLRQSQYTERQRSRRVQGQNKKIYGAKDRPSPDARGSDEEGDDEAERPPPPSRAEFTANQLQELETAGWERGAPFPEPPFPHASLHESKRPKLEVREAERTLLDLKPAILPRLDASRVTLREQFAPRYQFAVMSDILHRCLLEGDVDRASKAFGLLLRTWIDRDYPDITVNNYWGVAAEILARRTRQPPGSDDEWSDVEDGDEDMPDASEQSALHTDLEEAIKQDPHQDPLDNRRPPIPSLYTPDGIRKARQLLDRLILEYPYRPQQPDRVDARDFLQPMFTLWIHEIQLRGEIAITALQAAEDGFDNGRRAIKLEELRMARELAMRMDQTLGTFPHDRQPSLWELRGMVALWVGDLECNRYREGVNASLWAEFEQKAAKCFVLAERYGGSVWPGVKDIAEKHPPLE